MSHRKGFTLAETMIAIVVVGIVMTIGIPRLRDVLAHSDVRGARAAVIGLYATARAAAIEGGRTTRLHLVGNAAYVTGDGRRLPGPGTIDTIGSVRDLAGVYGVTMAAGVAEITVDPRGFASGIPAEGAAISLTHGPASDDILISAFGRVSK